MPLQCHVTLGKSHPLSGLSLLICRMGTTSLGYRDGNREREGSAWEGAVQEGWAAEAGQTGGGSGVVYRGSLSPDLG